ncbi:hypothetical protein ID866_4189 [Astraeus odoratus]|nr:hypothetical protein ID866_4189 [Astraeus odoratus]
MPGHDNIEKRSPNKVVHRNLAARFSPTFPGEFSPSTTSSADDKHSSTPNTSSVSATSQVVSSSPTSSSSHSSTSISILSTSSSPSATSSTHTSAATTSAATSIATTPAVVTVHSTASYATAQTSAVAVLATTPGVTTSTPSASSTSSSSGSVNVTTVVGGIAGTLVGIAVLGFLIMWLMRRRKEQDDDFNASIFRRQSVILMDDPPAPSHNPRPPTMIERHVNNASPALAAQRNFTGQGQNFYGGYGQSSFSPGEIVQPAYGQSAMGYGDPGQLARQPSNAAFLTRQPSAAAGYGDASQLARQPPNATSLTRQPSATGYGDSDAHYVDLSRSSVTPFQAAQYADISRRLNDMDTNVSRQSDDLHLPPLPSPFDDPAAVVPRAPAPAHVLRPGTTTPATAASGLRAGEASTDAKRPVSAYTVYEEGDAYDGI